LRRGRQTDASATGCLHRLEILAFPFEEH